MFFDTCQLHRHQRAKLVLTNLKKHICIHYSSANLDRLNHVRDEKLAVLKATIQHRAVRIVGKPPRSDGDVTLRDVIEILFDPSSEHHQRANGSKSAFITYMTAVADFCNDCLHSSLAKAGYIVHYCHCAATGEPCCETEADHVLRIGSLRSCFSCPLVIAIAPWCMIGRM